MKRFLLFVSAVAAMLLAGSCQQEINPVTDGDTTVTFTVSADDIATRAGIADGTNIDVLHWEIYKTAEIETAAAPLGENTIVEDDKDKNFTVELKLLADQEYTIIFWAEVNGTGHYYTGDLRDVKVNFTEVTDPETGEVMKTVDANDESRAAFFAVYPFETENGKAIKETVYLKRPFAQINLGSTTYETSFNLTEPLKVETTEMTVTNIATSFNTLTGKGEGEKKVTFMAAPTPNGVKDVTDKILEVNDLFYYWLGMNYLVVNDDADNVDVDITIVTNLGNVEHTIHSVPVKENYRTNLLGNFLTTGATFNVVVDERFQKPDEVIVNNGWSNVSGFDYVVDGEAEEDALAQILAHAEAAANAATKSEGPVVKIDLRGDVYWQTEGDHGSSPLLPVTSKISKVVINGNGNTFTATGAGVGSIRLANGGLLEFNDVNVVDKSVSYNEDAWELTYLEFAGNLAFNECTFNSGVQFQTEGNDVTLAASFTNCRFISNEDSVYAVWISDGTTTFNGCSFEGTRGLKMHEDYGSDVKSVTIDGCWFGPITKKPGVAIGDLNADTEVTIKNSKFSGCQAGDQGLYIYETDTDVTTFKFVNENNEVFADQNKMLVDAIADAAIGSEVVVPAGEYTFPASSIKEGMTLKCAEGTVFEGSSSLDIKGATVEGATFSNESGNAVGGSINGTFKDCKFVGANALRYCYAGETTVFENCEFSGNTYGAHFDGGANDILFKNCIFSGFNAFGGAIELVTFDGCTFKPNGKSKYNGANLWGSAKMINTQFIFDGTTENEWIDCISSEKSYEFTGCTINGGSALNPDYIFSRKAGTKIVFDGVEYTYKSGYYASSVEAFVTDAATFQAALDANEAKIVLMPGIYEGTFAMKSNVTVEGSDASVVDCINLNGSDNVTLKNIKFDAAGATLAYNGSGKKVQPANIITGDKDNSPAKGAHNVLIIGCKFTGAYVDGGGAVSFTDQKRGSGGSGNITIKECEFNTTGGYFDIYAYYSGDNGYFNIEGNILESDVYNPVYLGQYQSSVPVVVKNNKFNKSNNLNEAVYLQPHDSGKYTVSIDASGNTFAK